MRVILVLALIGAACAVPSQLRQGRIVGGEETSIENYPFMASMLYNSWLGLIQFCGGTLITPSSIVSAAHCYVGDLPSWWRVRLGSSLASSGGNLHTLSRIILHQQYNHRFLINDIAIIRLSVSAVFSDKINIARIAGPQYILPDNTLVHSIGWGDTEFEGNPSEVLQHVGVYVINHKLCAERYAYLQTQPNLSNMPNVTAEMFCAGIVDVGGKDACQGDSGGPVIHNKDVLVGITSWGYECAHPSYPGVNVLVSAYTDWISVNSVN